MLRRGEAAAAAHWPDYGSSSAVVHESKSGSSVCYSRQAGRVRLAVQLVAVLDCIRPRSWGGTESVLLGFSCFSFCFRGLCICFFLSMFLPFLFCIIFLGSLAFFVVSFQLVLFFCFFFFIFFFWIAFSWLEVWLNMA